MRYSCSNQRRLLAVKQAGVLNGIEYAEVRDTDETDESLRQRTLYLRLLLPVPMPFSGPVSGPVSGAIGPENVVIDGGERISSVAVEWAAAATGLPATLSAAEKAALLDGLAEPDHVLVVRTEARGDFSRYRIALVAGVRSAAAPVGFDPLLAEVAFSFKVECPSDFDCAPTALVRRDGTLRRRSTTSPRTTRASVGSCSNGCRCIRRNGRSAVPPTSASRSSS